MYCIENLYVTTQRKQDLDNQINTFSPYPLLFVSKGKEKAIFLILSVYVELELEPFTSMNQDILSTIYKCQQPIILLRIDESV